MPISSIAQVLLRLFALGWMITGVIQFVSLVLFGSIGGSSLFAVAPGLVYIVAGLIFWFLAPWISRLLAKGSDGEMTLEGVTEVTLFGAVLLGLGMYFVLSSFAVVISWVHFFTINKSPDYGFHQESGPSYYDLSEAVLMLAAGVALVFTARKFAAKLCRDEDDDLANDPNRPPPPEEIEG
jgi:hypothetical protein